MLHVTVAVDGPGATTTELITGGGVLLPKVRESNATELSSVTLWEVTARPERMVPVSAGRLTVEPGTAVHVTPSGDVYAVKVELVRATWR